MIEECVLKDKGTKKIQDTARWLTRRARLIEVRKLVDEPKGTAMAGAAVARRFLDNMISVDEDEVEEEEEEEEEDEEEWRNCVDEIALNSKSTGRLWSGGGGNGGSWWSWCIIIIIM